MHTGDNRMGRVGMIFLSGMAVLWGSFSVLAGG